MRFLKCSESDRLFQGFPGGKAITIWPLLSSLFSKSSYWRAPGADSWKGSILHPGQNEPRFRILLAHNGATSAPRWEGPLAGAVLKAPQPHTRQGRGSLLGENQLLCFLRDPGARGEKKGEAKPQSVVGQTQCASRNKALGLREELTSSNPALSCFLVQSLPNVSPGLKALDGFG